VAVTGVATRRRRTEIEMRVKSQEIVIATVIGIAREDDVVVLREIEIDVSLISHYFRYLGPW